MFGKRKPLQCPKCKDYRISIQFNTTVSKSRHTSPGLAGNTYNAARGVANIATLGIAGKLLPKAKGKTKTTTKIKDKKTAVCNNCGYSWKI